MDPRRKHTHVCACACVCACVSERGVRQKLSLVKRPLAAQDLVCMHNCASMCALLDCLCMVVHAYVRVCMSIRVWHCMEPAAWQQAWGTPHALAAWHTRHMRQARCCGAPSCEVLDLFVVVWRGVCYAWGFITWAFSAICILEVCFLQCVTTGDVLFQTAAVAAAAAAATDLFAKPSCRIGPRS